MMTLEEMQAFHLLRHYLYPGYTVDQKAKEAGDYIIDLANKIKKSREIGPWVTDPGELKNLEEVAICQQ